MDKITAKNIIDASMGRTKADVVFRNEDYNVYGKSQQIFLIIAFRPAKYGFNQFM